MRRGEIKAGRPSRETRIGGQAGQQPGSDLSIRFVRGRKSGS